jgi:putative glutamine amidotransferase
MTVFWPRNGGFAAFACLLPAAEMLYKNLIGSFESKNEPKNEPKNGSCIEMTRPVVGVIGNAHIVENRFAAQLVGERNLRAIAEVANALPLMFAGAPDITDIGALLDVVDGVLLTGARANVHPTHFGGEAHPKHEPYDNSRDALALALIDVCVARGVPVFGICRGFQEMNVAFGGSLHPEIRELPGRINHRMPRLDTGEIHPDPEVVFADRHDVTLVPGGAFAQLLGCETIRVNSLHGQGILEHGKRIVVEGVAEDGTIEAIRIADAPGFALGVQWHAEYDPQRNAVNRTLFEAFGQALVLQKAASRRSST